MPRFFTAASGGNDNDGDPSWRRRFRPGRWICRHRDARPSPLRAPGISDGNSMVEQFEAAAYTDRPANMAEDDIPNQPGADREHDRARRPTHWS